MTEIDMCLRVLAGAGLGFAIGLEREAMNKPAGLRTHLIVSSSSALLTTTSVLVGQELDAPGEALRVAAGVVTVGASPRLKSIAPVIPAAIVAATARRRGQLTTLRAWTVVSASRTRTWRITSSTNASMPPGGTMSLPPRARNMMSGSTEAAKSRQRSHERMDVHDPRIAQRALEDHATREQADLAAQLHLTAIRARTSRDRL